MAIEEMFYLRLLIDKTILYSSESSRVVEIVFQLMIIKVFLSVVVAVNLEKKLFRHFIIAHECALEIFHSRSRKLIICPTIWIMEIAKFSACMVRENNQNRLRRLTSEIKLNK